MPPVYAEDDDLKHIAPIRPGILSAQTPCLHGPEEEASAMQIDHVAHGCRNPRATHQFYATVLGLQLVAAYAGQDLMLVYALPDGGSMVFSTGARALAELDDSDWGRQHVGLTVRTRTEFENWLQRLRECGIRHRLVDGERVYFSDPDGIVLELEVASPAGIDPAASDVLQRWLDNRR